LLFVSVDYTTTFVTDDTTGGRIILFCCCLYVHRRLGLAALDLDPARPPCILVLGICTYSIVLFFFICLAISFIDTICGV
jgi:hypothetical protein